MRRIDVWCTVVCAGAVAGAFLLVNPWVQLPFDDDWSYAFTVHQLLQTGHLIYNGWGSPAIITQAYWGAAWAKIFGFSFTTLRFSTLPLAMGSAVVCFLLGRLCGLRPPLAVFAALLLGLSPTFLPLATSFMTDIPGLFFMLLSTYALARAAVTQRIAWLAVAVLAATVGGLSRQVVWIVPISTIPYLLWLGRKNRPFLAAAVIAWVLVLIGFIATQSWFSSQHDVVVDPPLQIFLQSAWRNPWIGLQRTGRLILTLFLFTLPVSASLAILVGAACRHRVRLLLFGALIGVALALDVHFHPDILLWPWSPNLVWPDGILISTELSGHPPAAIPPWCVTLWSVLVFIALGASLAPLLDFAARWRNLVVLTRRILSPRDTDAVLIIMAIVAIVYMALLFTRSMLMLFFDRYALPIIPIAAIFTLLFAQRMSADFRIRRVAFTTGAIILAFYTAFSLAATRDLLALARARVAAVRTLRDAGVAPTAIAAGFEYDCWTQLQLQGHVNYRFASNHSHPVNPKLGLAPALWCRYRVEYSPTPQTHRSTFAPVRYTSWLPPFHRAIYIDEFVNPWWLTRPPPDGRAPLPSGVDFEMLY
jgi:Dolichyl-phosphate-mannose-protein mannosyltransferase